MGAHESWWFVVILLLGWVAFSGGGIGVAWFCSECLIRKGFTAVNGLIGWEEPGKVAPFWILVNGSCGFCDISLCWRGTD